MSIGLLTQERARLHQRLIDDQTLLIDAKGVASNADGSQRSSRAIALHIAQALGARTTTQKLSGQSAGRQFEDGVRTFLANTFPHFTTLRPGSWEILNVGGKRGEYHLARYEPYTHLDDLAMEIERNNTLVAVLGNSYSISPDVLIVRQPEPDEVINHDQVLVDSQTGQRAIIRRSNQPFGIAHAIVSCKWTLRSDRAQNARSEALNVIRNRKGRTPHIVVVTAEPSPSRLASLALGTGDIDCVYHFALPELIDAVQACNNDEAQLMLSNLIDGKRLRDICDLVLDLTV